MIHVFHGPMDCCRQFRAGRRNYYVGVTGVNTFGTMNSRSDFQQQDIVRGGRWQESQSPGGNPGNLIQGSDRHCGYHFARYFHMLPRRWTSYLQAEAVHADLMGAFDYPPARNIAVPRNCCDASCSP